MLMMKYCLEQADRHDLGRTIFSLMNSCSRQAVLGHSQLHQILSTIQRVRALLLLALSLSHSKNVHIDHRREGGK